MAHYLGRWGVDDIAFEFVDDLTDDPVVTIRVLTPVGTLMFMAVPVISGTTMILRGLHVQDSVPNAVGPRNLMMVARAVMEGMELDGLVIEGALRSTGANPGHRPRDIRFARRVRVAPRAGQYAPADD